jgi:3-phenylpropionate/cinnamic acid dioxygenase small subunit
MNRALQDCAAGYERLSVAFAYYVDHRQYDALVALFLEDGVLDRRGEIVEGRDAIHAVMLARAPDIRTRHVCSNIFVSSAGDDWAEGVTYFTLYRGKEQSTEDPIDLTGASFVGEYHDRIARTPEGWKLARRTVRLVFQREPV